MSRKLFILAAALFAGYACAATKNIVETADSTAQLSTLVTALTAADLNSTLSGTGPFTVFAPNNTAFSALGDTLTELLKAENKGKLADVLKFHVVSGKTMAAGITNGMEITTLEGNKVTAKLMGGKVYIGGAEVITPDVNTTNGVVHIIGKVLIPPTVPQVVSATADFSTLVAALTAADLITTLGGAGPFTVFAPANRAFTATGGMADGVLDFLLNPVNKPVLTKVLTYHVHQGDVMAAQITNNMKISTLEGNNLTATVSGSTVSIDGTPVEGADNNAYNGVVHMIEKVLIPPTVTIPTENIVAKVTSAGLTGLFIALAATPDIGTSLSGKGPFTVFAPTNAAFDALGQKFQYLLYPENKAMLEKVLKYHVHSGDVRAAAISDNMKISTLGGMNLTANVTNGQVMIGAAKVVGADVVCLNGVVHTVDTVLVPPDMTFPPSLEDAVNSNAELTTLKTALGLANLTEILAPQGIGPFTVFAPNDAAFAADMTTIAPLLLPATCCAGLDAVLNFHFHKGNVKSAGITNNMQISTFLGTPLTATITGGKVFINGAEVVTADVATLQGTVHIINKVLTPPVAPGLPGSGVGVAGANAVVIGTASLLTLLATAKLL